MLSSQARKRLGLSGKPEGFTMPARNAARPTDKQAARSLLELIDHFHGNTLCWASDLLEEKKNEPE